MLKVHQKEAPPETKVMVDSKKKRGGPNSVLSDGQYGASKSFQLLNNWFYICDITSIPLLLQERMDPKMQMCLSQVLTKMAPRPGSREQALETMLALQCPAPPHPTAA